MRRRAIAIALVALTTLLGTLTAGCRGAGARDSSFDAGPIASIPPGSVTVIGHIFLTRAQDGTLTALSDRSPWAVATGRVDTCPTLWRPAFEFRGTRGWFVEVCSESIFDTTGHRVFGPSPRDLDRYPVAVRGGHIRIDTDRLLPARPSEPQFDPDAPPTSTAVP